MILLTLQQVLQYELPLRRFHQLFFIHAPLQFRAPWQTFYHNLKRLSSGSTNDVVVSLIDQILVPIRVHLVPIVQSGLHLGYALPLHLRREVLVLCDAVDLLAVR